MTIDVGFAYIDLPEVGRVSIVDVPGHERFVHNMLVGALGIDVALLCVAADESVMPQTREHLQILDLLPVERLVVALTRADLADAETREFAVAETEELLAEGRFARSPVLPVSAVTGEGLDDLRRTLAQALSAPRDEPPAPWYLPIDRVFTVKGHGTVVTGTLMQGVVREGDQAVLQPGVHEVRVRQVQGHDQPVPEMGRGSRTALNLGGVRLEDVHRGMVVGAVGTVVETTCLDARVRWVGEPKHGARVRVSIGADEAIARLFTNDHDADLVQLRFERPAAAVLGQPLVLRRYSPPVVLAGGRVVTPLAPTRRKNQAPAAGTGAGGLRETLVAFIVGRPDGADTPAVCEAVGRTPQALGDEFEALLREGALLGFAGRWFSLDTFAAARARFLAALKELHESDSRKLVWPREAVVARAGLKWQGKPLDRIVAWLAEEGSLRSSGTSVGLAGFQVELPARQRALLDRVKADLAAKTPNVPGPAEIAREFGVPVQAVEEIVRVGIDAGELVRLAPDLVYPPEALEVLVESARRVLTGAGFSASEFREAVGTTRKYAIPLLEWLDARGVTLRQGDSRVFRERIEG